MPAERVDLVQFRPQTGSDVATYFDEARRRMDGYFDYYRDYEVPSTATESRGAVAKRHFERWLRARWQALTELELSTVEIHTLTVVSLGQVADNHALDIRQYLAREGAAQLAAWRVRNEPQNDAHTPMEENDFHIQELELITQYERMTTVLAGLLNKASDWNVLQSMAVAEAVEQLGLLPPQMFAKHRPRIFPGKDDAPVHMG